MFDLADIGFVKRITVGSRDPEALRTEDLIEAAQDLLDRCLSETPRGRIIGTEKSFALLDVGEHHMVLRWLTCHVGWVRRPMTPSMPEITLAADQLHHSWDTTAGGMSESAASGLRAEIDARVNTCLRLPPVLLGRRKRILDQRRVRAHVWAGLRPGARLRGHLAMLGRRRDRALRHRRPRRRALLGLREGRRPFSLRSEEANAGLRRAGSVRASRRK